MREVEKSGKEAEEARQGDVKKLNHALGMSIITRRHARPAAERMKAFYVTMATDLHQVPEATVAITPDLGLHIIMTLANPRAKASIFFFTHRSLASVLLTALIISCLSLHSRERQTCVHHKCSLEYGCVHALCMELCLFHCNNHVRIYTYRFQF